MSGLKSSLLLMMFLVLSSQFYVFATLAEVGKAEAYSALTNAEGAVVLAYQEVLKAEGVGANVSGLLVRLNEAGGFLASANMSYRRGDFDEATRFANLSENVGDEVQNTAIDLKNSVWIESLQRLWFTMIGSIIGVILILIGSYWAWRVFKRSYYRRVLKMKPEVV